MKPRDKNERETNDIALGAIAAAAFWGLVFCGLLITVDPIAWALAGIGGAQ